MTNSEEVKPPIPAQVVPGKVLGHPPVPVEAQCPPPPPPGLPPPPGPPPPPPPGPPPPNRPVTSQNGSSSCPSDDLVTKCCQAFHRPELPKSLPELESVPDIDMTKKNEKNTEDSSEKMFMKKNLV